MEILAFIPSIVAFLALLLGVTGKPKWNEKYKGFARLTRAGWMAIVLGVAALLASQVLTWRAQQAADLRAQTHEKLRRLADSELRLAVRQITSPYFILLGDDSEQSHRDRQLIPESIQDQETLARAREIDIRSANISLSGVSYPLPWADVLEQNAIIGQAEIDRILQTYAAYLDPDVLSAVSDFRRTEYLWRLQNINEYVGDNSHVEFLPLPLPDPEFPGDRLGYGTFWESVKELDDLLVRDDDRLRSRP